MVDCGGIWELQVSKLPCIQMVGATLPEALTPAKRRCFVGIDSLQQREGKERVLAERKGPGGFSFGQVFLPQLLNHLHKRTYLKS